LAHVLPSKSEKTLKKREERNERPRVLREAHLREIFANFKAQSVRLLLCM
jgi:hypothetical protein